MNDSDIFQLIGKAYCDGMTQGMEKYASMEKQALSPELLLRAAEKAVARGVEYGSKSRNQASKFIAAATNKHSAAEQLAKALRYEAGGADSIPLKMMNERLKNIKDTINTFNSYYNPSAKLSSIYTDADYAAKVQGAASQKLRGLKWFNRELKALQEQFPAPTPKVVEAAAEAAPAASAFYIDPIATGLAGLGLGTTGGTIIGSTFGKKRD